MPSASRSSSDSVTIDSSPRRRLSQKADSVLAPGNLAAMPTTAIALAGSSLLLVTLDLLPFAELRLVAVLRRAAWPDHELRWHSQPFPRSRGPADGSGRSSAQPTRHPATTGPPAVPHRSRHEQCCGFAPP